MNTNFFIDCRWYTTPCKTVLNADEFIVEFLTSKHSIVAKISDKCYFLSIDNITLSDIKCDFFFSRNYTKPKEFLSKLNETFISFLNTSISDKKFPLCKNTDEVLDRIIEIVTATDPEVGKFAYDVVIHNFYGCDTFTVRADGLESVEDKALKRMKNEKGEEEYYSIDSIRIYKENSDELLKEIIFEPTETEDTTEKELIEAVDTVTTETEETTDPEIGEFVYDVGIHNFYECRTYTVRADNPESAGYKALKRMKKGKDDKEYYSIDFIRIHKENSEEKSELNTKYGVLADDQFHRLTKTLIKSLFKAIGTDETRKIPFIISNNMVFFNYNGIQYKYYPSQSKVFKKCGRKYQRINWKDFADDNSPTDQKQALGRSPPLLLI